MNKSWNPYTLKYIKSYFKIGCLCFCGHVYAHHMWNMVKNNTYESDPTKRSCNICICKQYITINNIQFIELVNGMK